MARTPKPSGRKRLPDKGRSISRKRRANYRERRRRFLIVCEGKQTEPNYFRRFATGNAVDVEAVGTGRNTLAVVEEAQRLREVGERDAPYDEVWVVFDKDDFPPDHFNQAIRMAENAGFHAAYSNQAFELWYVLHFDYTDTALSRQQYERRLTEHLGRAYRKNDLMLYNDLLPKQEDAIRNAERLLASYPNHNPAQDDPCTTVHLLVRALIGSVDVN